VRERAIGALRVEQKLQIRAGQTLTGRATRKPRRNDQRPGIVIGGVAAVRVADPELRKLENSRTVGQPLEVVELNGWESHR